MNNDFCQSVPHMKLSFDFKRDEIRHSLMDFSGAFVLFLEFDRLAFTFIKLTLLWKKESHTDLKQHEA